VTVFDLENDVQLVLFVIIAALEVFALVDAVLRPGAAFTAADKLTKPAWLLILGVSLVSCLAFQSPASFIVLLGLVAGGVYLVDVRPALAAVTRR